MSKLDFFKRAFRFIIRGVPIENIYVNVDQITHGNILLNRNILITGGGHGIGRDIAAKCVSEGANVIIIGRNEEKLLKTCKELGDKCSYFVFDLENVDEIEKFWKLVIQKKTKIDTLVCNAGISLHEGEILNVTVEQFEKQVRVNLESVYFLIKEFIKNKGDNDINILCISSERGFQRDDLPYGLTKAAINSLVGGITKRYYKDGVRINGIAPGITTSDLTKKYKDDILTLERVTPGRYILGEEIAEVACFLLSDASKCISGEMIPCDAGEYISSYVK